MVDASLAGDMKTWYGISDLPFRAIIVMMVPIDNFI